MGKHTKTLMSSLILSSILPLILLFSACSPTSNQGEGHGKDSDKVVGQIVGPITDTDGQVYQTIRIGQQIWMAENLKKTEIDCDSNLQAQFTNGLERGPGVKFYDGTPRYAYYKNDQDNGHGVIYNFSALQNCKLCPQGFRIPTKTDWEELVNKLGGMSIAGNELLINGKSGFNAELGGRIDNYGSVLAGSFGFWWSSDMHPREYGNPEAYTFEISSKGIIKIKGQDIRVGNYVRCIKE